MGQPERLPDDEHTRIARELFDAEGCVSSFVAAIADLDPHLLAEATDLAGFDEDATVRLMRLYDLVERDPYSSWNREVSEPPIQETRTKTPWHQIVGGAIMAAASIKIAYCAGAGVDPIDGSPSSVLGLGVGVVIYNINMLWGSVD